MASGARDEAADHRPVPASVRSDGRPTVDQLGEWSFPASDPPQAWTWDVPRLADDPAPADERH